MEGFFDTGELADGRWERLRPGGPLEWVPAAPTERVHVADVTLGVVEALVQVQDRDRARTFVGHLCECGCAVAPGETCPACLGWAIRDAARHSWRGPVVKQEVWA